MFADDPIFRDVKIVLSLYDDAFTAPLNPELRQKIENEGVKDENLSIIDTPSYENLCRFVIGYADGIAIASPNVDGRILKIARDSGKPILEYRSPDEEGFFDNYNRFYEELR